LQHVVEESDIALTDLPEATRNTVEDGLLVTEGGLRGARTRVDMLRGSMLVPCTALTAPQASVPPAPSFAPTQPAAPPASGLVDPNLAPTAVPPTAAPPAAGPIPGLPIPGATVALPVPPGGDTTPLPTVTPEPGLNCRQGG
jgi:protein phosphatase